MNKILFIAQFMNPLFSPYMPFERDEWAKLRNNSPMTLTKADLTALQGINEHLTFDEVSDIYLPLARLLNYYVTNHFTRQTILSRFLGKTHKIPFIIGIAGSVAVGKSTTARVIQALLSRWAKNLNVALVTTDGFLYPNHVLKERGIMNKKGFPISYDIKKLIKFVSELKSGVPKVTAPIYSHLVYDIVTNKSLTIENPDVLILEGLNVLQSPRNHASVNRVFVSDYVDFSIFVDAKTELLHQWYIERFLKLRESAFHNPDSYFKHYAQIPQNEATEIATNVWKEINEPNLYQNILPTKERASLILTKGNNHKVEKILLRK